MLFWKLFRVYICLEKNGENCNHIEEDELKQSSHTVKVFINQKYYQRSYRRCYSEEYIYLEENTENC